MNKIEALAEHLDIGVEDIENVLNEDVYCYGREEYLVLDESEAQEKAVDYIRETLWAFSPSFLAWHIGNGDKAIEEMIKCAQEKCEGCNDALLALVGDKIDELIDSAIASDGRGHFISFYDGEEHEVGKYYIYRIN
jgi:hypothetical protein